MRICFAVVFLVFPSTKTMRQSFSGTAEPIFTKLSPNDRGEMYFETSYRRLAKVVQFLIRLANGEC